MFSVDRDTVLARVSALRELIENDHGETVVAQMHIQLADYDTDPMSMTFSCPALKWEHNPDGVIHGGIVATMFDTAMGVVNFAMTGHMTPTINLTTAFLRPAPGDGTLIVRVHVTMAGRTVMHTAAEMWDSRDPARIVATAQGVFRNPGE